MAHDITIWVFGVIVGAFIVQAIHERSLKKKWTLPNPATPKPSENEYDWNG